MVRHFGLSLIQTSVVRDFDNYDSRRKLTVRGWVVELCGSVCESDPYYIKEKLAFLWVAICKRTWGKLLEKRESDKSDSRQDWEDSWGDMDLTLLSMWNGSGPLRELCLFIFRTLFEDVYLLEDSVVSSRQNVLTSLCAEVVTPEKVLSTQYEPDATLRSFAASPEGWLCRWSSFLKECIHTNESFAIRILQTLKTCLHWVLPLSLRVAHVGETLWECLGSSSLVVSTLAVDCLHVLLTRTLPDKDDFEYVVGRALSGEGISMLAQVYSSVDVDAPEGYPLMKKLVEMIVGLSQHLEQLHLDEPTTESYFQLVLMTLRHDSLILSGLSLQMWVSLLRDDSTILKHEQLILQLVECMADRLVDYSELPSSHRAKQFLELDFEDQPDEAVFLANYHKLAEDVVRIGVCIKPHAGLQWLGERLSNFFSSPMGQAVLSSASASRDQFLSGEPFLYTNAQLVLIESCVRAVSRWKIWYEGPDFEQQLQELNSFLESLCQQLLLLDLQDPLLVRKQVQTLVQFTPLLSTELVFKVLEKVITCCTFPYPETCSDEVRERIRDLRSSCGTELNRLAYLMPETLKTILPDLDRVISDLLSSSKVSEHESVAFKSFLLVVSQRSSIPDKPQRFSQIVDPELAAWSDPKTEQGLLQLPWFMERLGIVKISQYFQSRGIYTPSVDLVSIPMDEQGLALKNELKSHWSSVFPIRATRIFVQYTIEKLDHDSAEFKELLALWKPRIAPILPHILQLISQIQAYHNPANWNGLPEEVVSFVRCSTMERFWQQGVSFQTKDAFMEENVKAMHTLRDFADSVGHIVRYTREYAYLTIASISELDDTLYQVPDMPSILWKSVAGEPVGITLHSWRHLINSVLRNVIKNCPLWCIESFFSQLLPLVLEQLDELLVDRWGKVATEEYDDDAVGKPDNESQGLLSEELSSEMMEEHILRQLTSVVVRMLIDLVGLHNQKLIPRQSETRRVIFGDQFLLAHFLKILLHITSLKDSRCSFNCVLILRGMLPDLLLKDENVDKYLADSLIPSLVDILLQPFFQDCHSEACYTLTSLYVSLRGRSSYPAQVLKEKLPEVSLVEIQNLEASLVQSKSLRNQRNLFLSLINSTKEDSNPEQTRKTRLEQISKKKKTTVDPLESGSLTQLFEE